MWIPHSEDKDPESGPKVVEINIEEFAKNEGVDAYLKRYENVLVMYGEVYKAVFQTIRDGGEDEGGVLFHCTGLSPTLISSHKCCHLLPFFSFHFTSLSSSTMVRFQIF